jgi:FkbM family methyltransferase
LIITNLITGNTMLFKLLLFLKRTFLGRFIFNKRVATIRYGVARGMKRRGGIGMLALFLKNKNPEESFIKSLALTNKVVYDIGANFGEFSLFFSKATGPNGRVVAFDPVRQNCEAVADNLALNKLHNVQIIQIGVGSRKESKNFIFDPDVTQLASSNEDIKKAVRRKNHTVEMQFEIDSLDAIIVAKRLPFPDFIKIDVEGMESEVLEGMENCAKTRKPELFIEVHGFNIEADGITNSAASLKNIQTLYQILSRRGYSVYHVESATTINKNNLELAKYGHIYCT